MKTHDYGDITPNHRQNTRTKSQKSRKSKSRGDKNRENRETRENQERKNPFGNAPTSSCGLQSPVSRRRQGRREGRQWKDGERREAGVEADVVRFHSGRKESTRGTTIQSQIQVIGRRVEEEDNSGSGNNVNGTSGGGGGSTQEGEEGGQWDFTEGGGNENNHNTTATHSDTEQDVLSMVTTTATATKAAEIQRSTYHMSREEALSLVEVPVLMSTTYSSNGDENNKEPREQLSECQVQSARLQRLLQLRSHSLHAARTLVLQEEAFRSQRAHGTRLSLLWVVVVGCCCGLLLWVVVVGCCCDCY